MENLNQTNVIDFELLGFAIFENYSPVLFTVFFIIYIFTIIENMLIVLVVYNDTNLHTPMYFFIANLACIEVWYVSTMTPKFLAVLVTENKKISFCGCFAQLYMSHSLGITECYLLAIMSADRFMAICKPLRYQNIMNARVYRGLSLMCWIIGFLMALITMTLTSQVTFCGPYYVDHYFCDSVPLLSIACFDITVAVAVNRFVGAFNSMFNLTIVVLMYINIIYSIMNIKTVTGRKKAFSTCSSHLIVVTIFYGTICTVYATPKTSQSVEYDKLFSLVFTVFTPFLNPLIYTLRNKEVKSGLRRVLQSIQRHIK